MVAMLGPRCIHCLFVSLQEVTMNDNHSQMLARLEWELDQRKKYIVPAIHYFMPSIKCIFISFFDQRYYFSVDIKNE